MARDILFLLHPRFVCETGVRQFCPGTMLIEGVLSCFPDLRSRLDIRYVDFPKPRLPIVEVVGETKQGSPMLVRQGEQGPRAIEDLREILAILTRDYGVSEARGMQ
jgi:hypothetical protein